jgi:hypothetical protein
MVVATKAAGLEVVKKEYSIKPSASMFATWELSVGSGKETHFGILIINSINKSHSVILSAYEKIFVCSNFCFRVEQEQVMFRRHTGMLELEEIQYMAIESLKALVPRFNAISSWREDLKKRPISIAQATLMAAVATQRHIIPPTQLNQFLDLYQGRESKYNTQKGTVWAWHGAVTELMNDNSVPTIIGKQDCLNYFIDYEVDPLLKLSSHPTIDLKAEVESKGYAVYQQQLKNKPKLLNGANLRHQYAIMKRDEVANGHD